MACLGRTGPACGLALNVPPFPASNFVLGEHRAYSRDDGTPGWGSTWRRSSAASKVALRSSFRLRHGRDRRRFSINSPPGSVVALPDDCYRASWDLPSAGERRGRWTVHRAVTDTAGWVAMCGVADLIWLESPSNPLLTVAELDVICTAPRKRGAILGVDNTLATPLNQRPLALGADVAVQSVTKFIGETLGPARRRRSPCATRTLLAARQGPRARGCDTRHPRSFSRGPRGEDVRHCASSVHSAARCPWPSASHAIPTSP
jgi:cystathionine gamma-synthase